MNITNNQLLDFYQKIPKIELHAHLNGSLSIQNMLELKALQPQNTNSDLYEILGTDNSSWNLEECFKKFKIAHILTDSIQSLSLATKNVIKDFSEDNVVYLELRTTPRKTEKISKLQYIETVIKTIIDCQINFPNILVKLIPSIDRSQGLESAEENLELILKLKEIYPKIIKGIDLSGDPGKSEFKIYKNLLEKARNNGLKLALHCGEILNDEEVTEMLDFGMDRLGHGTYINQDLLIDRNIPIECCMTSNLKSGTVLSYSEHHFGKLFGMKYPVVVCTDDFGVFDTSLSNELRICAETFKLSKEDVLNIIKTSVESSFADADEKIMLNKKILEFSFK